MVHPPFGFSPGDVSKYYSKAFSQIGEDVFNFYSDRYVTYHTMAFDYMNKIGLYEDKANMSEILRQVEIELLGTLQVKHPKIIFVVHGISHYNWAYENMREIANRNGSKMVLLTTESPNSKEQEERIAPFFDHIFTTDLSGQNYLAGEYIGHSYKEEIHKSIPIQYIPSKFLVDIGFVGAYFYERVNLFERLLEKDYKMFLSGVIPDSEDFVSEKIIESIRPRIMPNEELPLLYNGADFIPNFTRRAKDLLDRNEDQSQLQKSVTIRMVEVMASGGLLITDITPELEEKFEEGIHYIGYNDFDELVDKIEYYRKSPDKRGKIRINAYNRIREVKRSYKQNARYILNSIN